MSTLSKEVKLKRENVGRSRDRHTSTCGQTYQDQRGSTRSVDEVVRRTWGCVDRVERTSTNYERKRQKCHWVKERWGDTEVKGRVDGGVDKGGRWVV